jgi:hypothetical protein
MANICLAYPNRIGTGATVSGGTWSATLPLANVADRQITKPARSTGATLAATKFNCDFGSARSLRVFALVNHNLSSAALWRVSLGTSSGGTQVYAGAWVNVWQLSLEAGLSSLGVQDADYQRWPFAAVHCLTAPLSARYLTIEVDDTTNTDGYVQIGRAFAAGAFQFAVNPAFGLKDGLRDLSSKASAESGAVWSTPRRRLRQVDFSHPQLTLAEGDTLHEAQRHLGTVDEVFYVPDPTDAAATQRYGFLGQLQELGALDYPNYAMRGLTMRIAELV